ncbi:hypothetical protein K493DRAFT_298326 [Basidiobolus meristosporus CBS 931.73]|nr:hypothetical protein K493DRAFT_298326 [Basidiobolus meristosporus CBS 931.73]|eukprot:ORY01544.1 hypothetical protein K493DRAFT_298326 [Basidiobolus meristosporus CBS 931.73]
MTQTRTEETTPNWVINSVPGVRLLLDLLLFAAGLIQAFWQYFHQVKRHATLTSTIHPTYSSLNDQSPLGVVEKSPDYALEVVEKSRDYTLVDIRPVPIQEKRPTAIPFMSYAQSVWSVDNRILGQLRQLEQAQSYLFRSINLLIDSHEGLEDVEELVETLSWEDDLSNISKANPAHLLMHRAQES